MTARTPGDCGWRKSGHSVSGGNCTEVGSWRKSSASESGNCAEVGGGERVVAVRDTLDRDGAVLSFGTRTWAEFTSRVKAAP